VEKNPGTGKYSLPGFCETRIKDIVA